MGKTQAASQDAVALAAELCPLLARNAAQAERDRRLPQENIEALEAANLFKLMTPRRWGGYGVPLANSLLGKPAGRTSGLQLCPALILWTEGTVGLASPTPVEPALRVSRGI